MDKEQLKQAPFNLDKEQIKWVINTKESMTLDEKIGQLFFAHGYVMDTNHVDDIMETMKPGGMMFRANKEETVRDMHAYIMEKTSIPLLIAANLEYGGNGLIDEGTQFASNMLIGATGDTSHAYNLGHVCATEGKAVGANMSFAPVIDINFNAKNPITNIRSFSDQADLVAKMGSAYVQATDDHNFIATIKHFPGDGISDVDQHLQTSVNSLSIDEWFTQYGQVYKECIESGAKALMAGHIAFPAYSEAHGSEHPLLPATLSKTLLQGLLREEMNYNGLILTDASIMPGLWQHGKRERLLPQLIAAGNDMILFQKHCQEDFEAMLAGYHQGVLTDERLDEAVTRILGLKASIGLYEPREEMAPLTDACKETHKGWARTVANEGITLAKNKAGLIPLSKETNKRIGVFYLDNSRQSNRINSVECKYLMDKLNANGFDVSLIQDPDYLFSYEQKTGALDQVFDMIVYFADTRPLSNTSHLNIPYKSLKGFDCPWFADEVATVFISVASPYHVKEVPMVDTFINCYYASIGVMDSLVDKLLGKDVFRGKSPVNIEELKWKL